MASDDDEEYSDADGLSEDMEALKRACMLTGMNPSSLQSSTTATSTSTASPSNSDAEDDVELVRNIQKRFSSFIDIGEPKPLCSLPPVGAEDDVDDDFETLRAIQRRFAAYDDGSQKESVENDMQNIEQVGVNNIGSEQETSNNLFVQSSNVWEGFPNCVDKSSRSNQNFEACSENIAGIQPSDLIEWHKSRADDTAKLPVKGSNFPKSAQAFVDAIKKNRSCQKFIRSKLMHIEARMEEIRKLKDRVKILKDFQVSCRKRTGRALSQKRDARVQLISLPKLRVPAKLNEKKSSAMCYGPAENAQIANYREELKKLPVSLHRDKWSKKEKQNLAKGVKQQFQEMLLQRSLDLVSYEDGSLGDSGNLDSIVASIRDLDITPENMRLFLPKVNWDQLASMYVPSRSGAECQARWLNFEDPLINHNPNWSTEEDRSLLHVVQQKGLSNWIDIAVSLGTNRTPFKCLARYQRSLNASLLHRNWTEEEDNQLRAAVEAFGESNWQLVASVMEGRHGPQCSNRWNKTLLPARKKKGRWTPDEDKRLKVAVMLFGPKSWNKIAQFVPGRIQNQCRERWVNSLDPTLNFNGWTEEEDRMLAGAVEEHGYCWSKVAACVPPRTDNQCWRRWKVLFPQKVPLLRAVRNIKIVALRSNFVDRESERPALGPNDFVPLQAMTVVSDFENANPSGKRKSKSRRSGKSTATEVPSGSVFPGEVPRITIGTEVENLTGESISKRKRQKRPSRMTPDAVDFVSNASSGELETTAGGGLNCKRRISRGKPDSIEMRSGHDATFKRTRKPHSKKGEYPECHLPCLPDPSSVMITTGEGIGGLGRDDEVTTWHKEASKLHPRRCRYTEMQEDEGPDSRGCQRSSLGDPSLLSTTNAEDSSEQVRGVEYATECIEPREPQEEIPESCISNLVETDDVGGTITRKKRKKAKSTSKKNQGTDSLACHFFNPNLSVPADQEVGKLGRDEARKSKRTTQETYSGYKDACEISKLQKGNTEPVEQFQNHSSPIRSSTPDIQDSGNSKALDLRGHNKITRSKGREFLDKIVEEDDDMTLASFLQKSGDSNDTLLASLKVTESHKKGVENAKGSKNDLRASDASESNRLKRSRNACGKLKNRMSTAETGDDTVLAVFCNNLKRRKLELANAQD